MILTSSDNKTSKFLVHIDKTTYVETTYVDYHNKHIVCFSSMAGCPVGCTFCISGQGQTYRKLTADEMVTQCQTALKDKVINKPILFSCMGEGEPLLNYTNVINALKTLGDMYTDSKLALSTTGIKPYLIKQLSLENFPVPFKLQISIHATTDSIRQELMPLAPSLDTIEEALLVYLQSGNDIELNYVLLDGINDSDMDAVRLASFAKNIKIKLNMLNPIPNGVFQFTNRFDQFCRKLYAMGANYEFYATDGTDINAACGQLSYKFNL